MPTERHGRHIFSEAFGWDWEQLSGAIQQQYLERKNKQTGLQISGEALTLR